MTTEEPLAAGIAKAREYYLERYAFGVRVHERGEVVSIGDGIAWVAGLPSAAIDQLLEFEDGSRALVSHLREEVLAAIMLDEGAEIAAGSTVHLGARNVQIPVGDAFLGRIVDPLGRPLDGGEIPHADGTRALDVGSPRILERDFVRQPLSTGNKICDALIPIGRGQRQLLLGDRGLGKTAFALDVIANQRNTGVLCIYVLIGQPRADVINVLETLEHSGALAHTCVVVGEATALPGLQYLAPFAGCSLAEYWMRKGGHTLVIYDDLTRHAYAYRSLSLLLRRPPGREAYPGDIFFLHSRLLERATALSAALGGGTLTALPMIETEEGEIANYIPTNLISITDGQIAFSEDLFAAGNIPAIDVRISVSRVGGKAQDPLIRAESGRIRLDYLQFLELERFTRVGARVDPATTAIIARGRILREIFKQARLAPVSSELELLWLVAYNEGLFNTLQAGDVPERFLRLERATSGIELGVVRDRATWAALAKDCMK